MRILERVSRLIELSGDETRGSADGVKSTLAAPTSWLVDMLGGGRSKSGVTVNEQTAMRMTTVWACITLVSETVAQLPLNLYERKGDKKQIARNHPVYYLLTKQPNPFMTSFQFRETKQAHAMGWGNACSVIVRKNGKPIALLPLMPNVTRVDNQGGKLRYVSQLPSGEMAIFEPEDILHIPAMAFDGIRGISPIRQHAESIGLALAAQEFGARFYADGAHMGGILTSDKKIDPADAKAAGKRFRKAYSGLDKSHSVAVLGEGLKFERTGIPPVEAQFLDTRKFQRSEVASIYKIPPHMIGDLEKSSFNNITEQSIQYVRYAVAPWLRRWEEELNRKFFPSPSDRLRYYFKFELDALLRGTPEERSAFYKDGINDGWLSRNEVRGKEDMNPEPGLDNFLVPMNMEQLGEKKKGKTERSKPDVSVFQPLIRRFAEQLQNADEKACLRGAKQGNTEKAVNTWRSGISEFVSRHLDAAAATMEGAGVNANGLTAAVAVHIEEMRTIGDAGVEALPAVSADAVEKFMMNWLEGRNDEKQA